MSFADQPAAVAMLLQRSLQRGRLAHAYLFHGPRGSGKETTARTLAKALNCEHREHDSCDACDSCRRIDDAAHPDVYWVRPESKSRRISVDQIREFERSISLRATMARVKVGVVVDADCLGDEASNAFLKTLEEPPAQTVILLLTAEPQRLLPTILSRCLRLSFGAGGEPTASPYRPRLVPLLETFSAQRASQVVATYALLAGLTAILNEIREETRARFAAEHDLEKYPELDSKVREKLEAQLEARLEGAYRAAREQVLEDLYGWFGDVLLCTQGADAAVLSHPDNAVSAGRVAAGLRFEQAVANLEAVEEIRESLARHIAEPLAFEVGLLKLA